MGDEQKLKRGSDLTKEDVLRIWTMRAGKICNLEVAKEIGCHQWVVSDVIRKGLGPQVPIPPGIRKAALATIIPHNFKKRKAVERPEALHEATEVSIPAFFTACLHAEQARSQCLAAGISENTLNLMQMAAQEQAGTARKKA